MPHATDVGAGRHIGKCSPMSCKLLATPAWDLTAGIVGVAANPPCAARTDQG